MSSTVEMVPIGDSVFRDFFRIVRVKRCVDDPGSYGVESNVFLCVFHRRASGDGFKSAFRDHGNGSGYASDWVIGQRGA